MIIIVSSSAYEKAPLLRVSVDSVIGDHMRRGFMRMFYPHVVRLADRFLWTSYQLLCPRL